jgi:DNA invertase Pin-like site-specific DNA recombinase
VYVYVFVYTWRHFWYAVNMDRRTALYVRVSTNQQSSGLEAQKRALETYCAQNGITNFQIYADEGISGARASRPALDRLIKDCEQGQISQVIVYSFSRFARSTRHLIQALEFFGDHSIAFVSLSERLDTSSASGRAIFTILAAISQLERELIVERVKNGLANARAKGKQLGRKKTRNVELIRELGAQGFSQRKIARLACCSKATVMRELRQAATESSTNEEMVHVAVGT